MDDELKDLIMNASLDDNEEDETVLIFKESTKEDAEDTSNAENAQEQENAQTVIEETFIIPDAPIFSIESEIPEETEPAKSNNTEKKDLLNIEHFSDYKSREEGFSKKSIFDDIDAEEEEEIPVETYENITILDDDEEEEEQTQETVPPADPRKEDPDRARYNPKKPRKIDTKFEFIELFVFTLLAVVLLTTFVFRHSAVKGSSMENTLHENDHLIISDLFYSPDKGDIIVFQDPETGDPDPLVKRVIATEGDTVEILWDGIVLVNGEPIPDEYIKDEPYDNKKYPPMQEITVPKDMIFVLGDNRNNSLDSRKFVGTFVREDAILGKVILRIYPNFGKVE